MPIIVAHSGKQHSYHVAKALYKLKALDGFYTSSYIANNTLQKHLLKNNNTFWTKRFIEGLPSEMVHANWRFEIPELILRFKQGKSDAVQKAVYKRDVNFDNYMASQLIKRNKKQSNLIYWGFQGSCLKSLHQAKKLGIPAWCELATAHVVAAKRILGEEALLHPEWASTIDNLVFPADYEKRLEEEPLVADRVIAASKFTHQTLLEIGIQSDRILDLPLGCDIDYVPYTETTKTNFCNRPLKLLYAGTVTQRKGIKYLLESIKQLNNHRDIELHIIGGIQNNSQALEQYKGLYNYHTPMAQSELFKQYGNYDALVLPTVFEGFGLVIVEAMAAGLPVITTPHSMGPDIIEDDKNGYIIPIRNIDALSRAIVKLREKSNDDYLQMRASTREAALNYSWDAYKQRLEKALIHYI